MTILKEDFDKMQKELNELRELVKSSKEVDWDLVKQFKEGLNDVKAGRIERVA